MKKNKHFAFLVAIVFLMVSICTGSIGVDLIASASSSDDVVNNEVLFTIPLGSNGIHYEGDDDPDLLTWGPTALTVAPDGTFWIADSADDHLLRFDGKGILLDKIDIRNYVIGAGDIAVTSEEIWVLDMASSPPKLVHLSLNGKLFGTNDLPDGLHLRDGLSGITLDRDGSVLIERMGGYYLTRLISPTGKISQEELNGYEFQGKAYSAQPADMTKQDASQGAITLGNNRIDVEVINKLGALRILHVHHDGNLFVEIEEVVLNDGFQVDHKVYQYDSIGNLMGMARVPHKLQYVYVANSVAVGPDGDVFALITRSDSGEIQKLLFYPDLPSILPLPAEMDDNEQTKTVSLSSDCRSRVSMMDVADEYLNNSVYLNSYHINDNSSCSGRVKPSYLDAPGYYSSVSYAYGMWDSVTQFNDFMSGGYNGYFAGNTAAVTLSCARGIDCSGLVSRA
jgi:hypothetical protein